MSLLGPLLAIATPAAANEPPQSSPQVAPPAAATTAVPNPPEPATPEPSDAEVQALMEALQADRAAVEADRRSSESADAAIVSGASMNPNISLILDMAGAWFSAPDDDVAQGGAHDPTETGVNLQQLEMYMSSNVDPFFRVDVNLVFSQFGVELEEAYATTLSLPASLQMRAGQLLTRFGRLNPTHPHSWAFADQPLVNGKMFGGESSRGLGAEVSWLTPLPWFVEVLASATQADGQCCARSFFGGQDLGVRGPEDLVATTAIKQFFPLSRDWSLLWGLSGQFGPNPSGQGNRTEIYGTDLYLRFRPAASADRMALSLQAEGMFRTRQLPGEVLQDWGTYAQLVWNIDKRWETGARFETVSGLEDDPLDPDWTSSRRRTSLQITFYPSHFSRLRLQGSRDEPPWLDEPTDAVFLALEVLAGAHGAHKF